MWPHFDLTKRLEGTFFSDSHGLDLGCGSYSSEIAQQVLEFPWASLTSVDAFGRDLDAASRKQTNAKDWTLEQGDIREWVATAAIDGKYFDITMAFDVLEHLPKADAHKFLKDIEKITRKKIVLFIPIEPEGFHRKNDDLENHLQEHLSHWQPHELESLGYEVEKITDCHSERQEDGASTHYGAMWAIKKL